MTLRAAFLGGLPLEQAAQKAGVPVQTARRWKSESAAEGDDWDKFQAASLLVSGGGFEQAMGRAAAAMVLRCEALLERLQHDNEIDPLDAAKAIASLSDSLSKAHVAAKRFMPETDRLAVENESVKAFVELLLRLHPAAADAALSAMEAFARGER